MKKGFAGVLIVLAGVGGQVLTAGATQLTPVAGFRALMKSAETVVAVEILRVDNRATAADGSLILEVKVEKGSGFRSIDSGVKMSKA